MYVISVKKTALKQENNLKYSPVYMGKSLKS